MSQEIIFELDSGVYSKESIIKCLYWHSNDYTIDIKSVNGMYHIRLNPLNIISEDELSEIKRKLNREFLDYNLRDIVKKETNTIRELIIAKAFSNGEFDEEPKGDLMDPLGIKFL